MTVQPKELPKGSQLIMGLNPPFGVKGALANKFIDKALEFKPKLLILIVPPETERLDKKKILKCPYELVWEDNNFLSGKSFYLPGSVDTNDKRMDQWNVMAPPLYLWSRSDFAAQHKSIAEKHGHLAREPDVSKQEINHISEPPLEDHSYHNGASELKGQMQNRKDEECRQETYVTATPEVCNPPKQYEREVQDSPNGQVKSQSSETPTEKKGQGQRKEKRSEENHGRRTDGNSHIDGKNGARTPKSEMYSGIPNSSPSNLMARTAVEGVSSNYSWSAAHIGTGENVNQHFNTPAMSSSQVHLGTYGDTMTRRAADDMGRRYGINDNDPYQVGAHGSIYGTYFNDVDRESNLRSQVHLNGLDPNVYAHRSYPSGLDPVYDPARSLSTPPYGQLHGAAVDPSYRMNTSAMQRYAPRLDELNHSRMGTPGPDPPMAMGNRNAFFDHRVPHPMFDPRAPPGMLNPRPPSGMFDPRAPPPIIDPRASQPPHPMGFAPGLHHPYAHQSSAGWLNE